MTPPFSTILAGVPAMTPFVGPETIERRRGRPFGEGELPFAGGWTKHRDFPPPQGPTFQRAWRQATKRRTG